MMKLIAKYLVLIFLLIQSVLFAENSPASKAEGVFMAVGVGARLPVAEFSNSTDLGYGLNLEASYTDSDYLPCFIFARIGYDQFPGSQDFYKETDYSNYSITAVPVSLGLRYYFSPMVESIVLLMPIVEGSVSYTYFHVLNEFKVDAGKTNYTDEMWKFGGTIGAGVSMFILEIIANYNYYDSYQYVSFNLNVRLPLLVNF